MEVQRIELDGQRIPSAAHEARHIKRMGHQHVGGLPDFVAVDVHGREGIQAFEDQLGAFPSGGVRSSIQRKRSSVPPFLAFDPPAFRVVMPVVGRIDNAPPDQCRVDVPRDVGADPVAIVQSRGGQLQRRLLSRFEMLDLPWTAQFYTPFPFHSHLPFLQINTTFPCRTTAAPVPDFRL
ncbi:hypothetical protein D1872_230940 [compost metagenome]